MKMKAVRWKAMKSIGTLALAFAAGLPAPARASDPRLLILEIERDSIDFPNILDGHCPIGSLWAINRSSGEVRCFEWYPSRENEEAHRLANRVLEADLGVQNAVARRSRRNSTAAELNTLVRGLNENYGDVVRVELSSSRNVYVPGAFTWSPRPLAPTFQPTSPAGWVRVSEETLRVTVNDQILASLQEAVRGVRPGGFEPLGLVFEKTWGVYADIQVSHAHFLERSQSALQMVPQVAGYRTFNIPTLRTRGENLDLLRGATDANQWMSRAFRLLEPPFQELAGSGPLQIRVAPLCIR